MMVQANRRGGQSQRLRAFVPHDIARDPTLSIEAKGLLLIAATYADWKTGETTVAVPTLAEAMGKTERHLRAKPTKTRPNAYGPLTELLDRGLLTKRQRRYQSSVLTVSYMAPGQEHGSDPEGGKGTPRPEHGSGSEGEARREPRSDPESTNGTNAIQERNGHADPGTEHGFRLTNVINEEEPNYKSKSKSKPNFVSAERGSDPGFSEGETGSDPGKAKGAPREEPTQGPSRQTATAQTYSPEPSSSVPTSNGSHDGVAAAANCVDCGKPVAHDPQRPSNVAPRCVPHAIQHGREAVA